MTPSERVAAVACVLLGGALIGMTIHDIVEGTLVVCGGVILAAGYRIGGQS